jgi:hypothetical protein
MHHKKKEMAGMKEPRGRHKMHEGKHPVKAHHSEKKRTAKPIRKAIMHPGAMKHHSEHSMDSLKKKVHKQHKRVKSEEGAILSHLHDKKKGMAKLPKSRTARIMTKRKTHKKALSHFGM